jgi:hypothetical protein
VSWNKQADKIIDDVEDSSTDVTGKAGMVLE